eukprot:TRINITY_DN64216_c0_g1_i1.p1 TRINITY_DN64216_c0_g1~~TRINITY_DN64216_c0_g1_i1.p1  ORF type:complete len:374 (+),score=68.30 TRINITY_DN64216_c0_g1_i1:83-1204(+)
MMLVTHLSRCFCGGSALAFARRRAAAYSTSSGVDLASAQQRLRDEGYALLPLGAQATAQDAEVLARTLMGTEGGGGGQYNAGGGVSRPTLGNSNFLNAAEGAPPSVRIQPHNEMAYAREFPETVSFIMLRTGLSGGVTELYDNVRLTRLLQDSPSGKVLLDKIQTLGMQYVRLLHSSRDRGQPGFFSCWQDSFVAERFDDALRKANEKPDAYAVQCDQETSAEYTSLNLAAPEMKAVSWAPLMVTHPQHGELIFSSILNRHASWLDGHEVFGPLPWQARPYQCTWGDGTELSSSELAEIREAHEACKIELPLQKGDLIVLDNLYVQHGRAPFVPAGEPRLMGLLLGKMMQRESFRNMPPPGFAQTRTEVLARS